MKNLMFQFILTFILLTNTTLKAQFNNLSTVSDSHENTPSLIPFPQKIIWSTKKFNIDQCSGIYVSSNDLLNEAKKLQQLFSAKGFKIPIKFNQPKTGIYIEIIEKKVIETNKESYAIFVSEKKISIQAETAHGVFNATQTLAQLINNNIIRNCEITDWPAFTWRGFMVDVGRNFQSIAQLKKQIDVMAAYKLNIFHFHLTEDIAWRLQSKIYPELTFEKNMIRNQGMFYSFDEMRDLIHYCNERHITLVPEIDMPGHSAAFKRAMGVDMQSEKGTEICKNILTELCNELDVPMVHIGGDEVVISNPSFLTQMTQLLLSKNKKVIAWNPGGVLPEGTTLQMWNGKTKPKLYHPSIDSRHLYLNHFDPIDGVVTTFNHKICDTTAGNNFNLGATLCNWPDRKVSNEQDLIKMNAVFPVLLTFSERCWKGGGWENYVSDIGVPGAAKYIDFQNFEDRLLMHKKKYFKNKPFPYFKQSHMEWSLIGPFDNHGDTKKTFYVETIFNLDSLQKSSKLKVYGSTIWLRHFWEPMIQSHIANQNDSTTYYAITKIWSDQSQWKNCWIGFNNLSRSTATDSPPLHEWDEKNSKIWVNHQLVSPPTWTRASKKGDSEIPLIDENYEIRPPSKIFLKKGWNYVLIKAPVGSFKAKDWQNQVKWMFSFLPHSSFSF